MDEWASFRRTGLQTGLQTRLNQDGTGVPSFAAANYLCTMASLAKIAIAIAAAFILPPPIVATERVW